jgi:thiamine transport system substrate-binding protein
MASSGPKNSADRFARNSKSSTFWTISLAVIFVSSSLLAYLVKYVVDNPQRADHSRNELRILAYSSFTSTWGPGPEIAKLFEAKFPGAKVILLQADDAGLLLAKLQSFPADIVLGFDQLGKRLAEKKQKWRAHGIDPAVARFSDHQFVAFDWAPLGFIYRVEEIEPPIDFADLLSPRFAETISLQDPRSSSPGFQFVNWLVLEMGEDAAFEFLRKLKPNVHSTSGSWSQAYGLFTRGLSKLTFGYATSILYHRLSEKDDRYKFISFSVNHPVQVEYAAIADKCHNCDLASQFLKFLLAPEAQASLMNKNWMLPVDDSVAKGTPFEEILKEIGTGRLKIRDLKKKAQQKAYDRDPDKILQRWRKEVL